MRTLNTTLVALLLLLLGVAVAQSSTPAGTEITNQASATFNDSAGLERTTTSNQVVTIVQQVYSVTVTPNTNENQSKNVTPGSTAYFNYVVTNTGNGADSIKLTAEQVAPTTGDGNFGFDPMPSEYLDANCNGTIDSGENESIDSVDLGTGAFACVIVAAGVPTGVDAGDTSKANLTATPNDGNGSSDVDNHATAVVSEGATFDVQLSVSPSGAVAAGGELTYTLRGALTSTTGAYAVDTEVWVEDEGGFTSQTKSGLRLESPIPPNTTFADSLTSATGIGTATPIYWVETEARWQLDPGADTVTTVGIIVEPPAGATAPFFAASSSPSLTMSFDVGVDDTVTVDDTILNSGGTLTYGTSDSESESANSNSTRNPIEATYAVDVGRSHVVSASTGELVLFDHTLTNTGTAPDSYRLASEITTPAGGREGWTCEFRYEDGYTPLPAVIGPLAPSNDVFDFTMACRIPATDAPTESTVITITATSEADGVADTTTDTIDTVTTGYGVDLTSNEADSIASRTAVPNEVLVLPLEVENEGDRPDAFHMTADLASDESDVINLSDWSVVFEDAGSAETPQECPEVGNGSIITTTAPVAVGEVACVVAKVSIPAGAGMGTADLDLTATSANDAATSPAADSILDVSITIDQVRAIVLDPDRANTVTAPGNVTYDLSLRNHGNATDTAAIRISGASETFGWTYQIDAEGDGWEEIPEDGYSITNLAAASDTLVKVRVIVPAGQPTGRVETVTLTASVGSGEGRAVDTATLTTTVVGGDLVLEKSAKTWDCTDDFAYVSGENPFDGCGQFGTDGDKAEPGHYIEYTLIAANIGTAHIDEVVIVEPLPNFTEYVDIRGEASFEHDEPADDPIKIQFMKADGTWSTASWSSDDFATGEAIYIGLDTHTDPGPGNDETDPGSDGTINEHDKLPPSEHIEITFVVQVK